MATRQQVEKLAKKLGVSFSVEKDYVQITAPKGHCFSDQTYGKHYSDWPVGKGEDYTKAYVYECCMEMLKEGVEPCECEQCEAGRA